MKNKNEIYNLAQSRATQLLQRLGDIRFTGQLIFVVLVLLISWSGVKTIQSNYNLQKQISELNQRDAVQKLQNTNLALQNQYLKSDQYLELSARQNFGLASPGEKEIIVPQSVALAYAPTVKIGQAKEVAVPQPTYQRHFQSWMNFFLHRQSN